MLYLRTVVSVLGPEKPQAVSSKQGGPGKLERASGEKGSSICRPVQGQYL